MSFFQIAYGPILSIPIYSKVCQYGPHKFSLKKMTRTHPLDSTSKSWFFVAASRLVNSPLLIAIWSVVIQHSKLKFLTTEIVLMHEWMMHVQFEYIIPASFGLMMLRERRTPWYLLIMEGAKVHIGIGTIYRRIHLFPLIVWSILLVHHGMFEAWKWLTYIGGGCLYSVGVKLLVVVLFGLLEDRHHDLWAKIH